MFYVNEVPPRCEGLLLKLQGHGYRFKKNSKGGVNINWRPIGIEKAKLACMNGGFAFCMQSLEFA